MKQSRPLLAFAAALVAVVSYSARASDFAGDIHGGSGGVIAALACLRTGGSGCAINTAAADTSFVFSFGNTGDAVQVFVSGATPEAAITGSIGDLAVDTTVAGNIYIKATGSATNTGWALLWTAANDGATSGLDADLLDGSSSAAFAVVAGGNTFAASNDYAANDITDADVVDTITASLYLLLSGGTMTGNLTSNTAAGVDAVFSESGIDRNDAGATTFNVQNSGAGAMTLQQDGSGVWTAANDGAASGLDADLLDGSSSAAFAVVAGGNTFASSNNYAANDIGDADVVDTITASNYLPLAGGTLTGSLTINNGGAADAVCSETGIDVSSAGAATFNVQNSGAGAMTLQQDGSGVWTAANDGSGSTLDADLLDGSSSAAFALVAGGNTFASSNAYAANDITDADVVDTITASSYMPLAGGSFSGTTTYAAVATDIATGTNEDFTGTANGTGRVLWSGGGTAAGQNATMISAANAPGEYASVDGTSAALSGATLDTPVWAAGHTLSGTPVYNFTVNGAGHLTVIGSGTAISGAGSCVSESLTSGNDTRGQVIGTCTVTQTIVVTFGRAFSTAPFCTVSAVDAAGATTWMAATASTTTLTMTAGGTTTAGSYNYICLE